MTTRSSPNPTVHRFEHAVIRVGLVCAAFATAGIAACRCWDHCSCNPCADGSFCNGLEICTIEGGDELCLPGEPLECEAGTACDEDALAALIEEWRDAGGNAWADFQSFTDACLPVTEVE